MAIDLAHRAWARLRMLAVIALIAVVALPAAAVDVTNLLDSGVGSLRDAINTTPDGGTINFAGGATAGTITLTTGEIAFAKSLALVGPGAGSVTVSGNNASRIFNLTDSSRTFAISGLTLQNAAATGQGGAITTRGALVVDGVQFNANQASDGGGALFIGRAVLADQGTVIIKNSSFSANSVSSASGAGGGAILLIGAPGLAAALTMVNSTVSGNFANASMGMAGGGIAFTSATVNLISSTIAFNRAGAAGADLDQGSLADSSLTLRNSIVSNGTIDAAPIVASDRDVFQPGGATISSLGFNVVQRRSAATGYLPSDAPDGTDPQLAGLGNNGGSTLTRALPAGSPALDFVPIVQCLDESGQPLLRDQRGPSFTRQAGGNLCDAGAFEAQPLLSDLTITKTHIGNFAQGQSGATYTITVTNAGGLATSGTVTVVDTLPSGLTATALTGTGWTCNTGTRTCTRSDVLGSGASYAPITLVTSVAANAAASITNVATVSGGGEVNTANNTASDVTAIIPGPDLTLTKTHGGNFTQGQTAATYTITVHNGGGTASTGTVNVVDTLPVSLTPTALSGTGWTCTLGTLTCTRSDALAAGASYPAMTLTVTVANDAPASITNTATVSGGGDVNTTNNVATDATTVTQLADLSIAKSHVGSLTQGQSGATYTITVSNTGSSATSGVVTVVDALPAGLTATAFAGTGWACNVATLNCTRSDVLAGGASYPPLILTVNVSVSAPASITNTASVSGGGEVNTTNDTASDVASIVAGPDLTISKTHGGNFVQGQAGASYTITVRNAGASPTVGAVGVVDTLPAGLTATGLSGTGWSCALGTLTCTRSDALAANASYPAILLTADVANNAPGSVVNTATVAGGGDVITDNNIANDATTITPASDLTIVKSHVGNLTAGQIGAIYTITVGNAGPGPTSGTVTVVDTLPTGLTATAFAGPGWTCNVGTLTCTRADVIASGASYPPLALAVNVSSSAPTSLINTATASGGGEINTANDTASDPTTIVQGADIGIATTHSGNFQPGATGVTYTIVVSNAGPAPTTGTVTVVDNLPPQLVATAIAGTGWTCTLSTLTCTRSDPLAAGASYPPITLTVDVAATATGVIVNSVTVSGGGDVTPGNANAIDAASLEPALVAVPTLSQWLIAVLAAALALAGVMALRRKDP